jgi:membrane-associated phospholipid phosphatase
MRYCLILLIAFPFAVQSQSIDSIRQKDAFRALDAVGFTFSSPARWRGKDWVKLGGVLVATATLTLADEPIRKFWQNQNSAFLDGVNTVGYHYGKPYSALGFTGGFYVAGLIARDDWLRETGLILATSLFSAGMIERTLKPVVGRARPSTGVGNYETDFFSDQAGYHSFPSGHASMAFTISMVVARRTHSIPVKIVFFGLAASTVVCRLYSDAHWISDVAFGGTVAWFCADVALKRLAENKYRQVRDNRFQWKVYPQISGLTIRGTF